jgi:hypothetical protein
MNWLDEEFAGSQLAREIRETEERGHGLEWPADGERMTAREAEADMREPNRRAAHKCQGCGENFPGTVDYFLEGGPPEERLDGQWATARCLWRNGEWHVNCASDDRRAGGTIREKPPKAQGRLI